MKKTALFLILCFMVFSTRAAQAQLASFGDSSKFWPGWNNNTSDDTKDSIGVPNFTGGQAVVNNGLLTSLTINRTSAFSSVLSPGDLFIDLGANSNWDYVVDLTNWTQPGPSNPDPAAGNYGLYSITLALNSPAGYILSGTDNTNGWNGYNIRDTHPVAAANIDWQSGGPVYFNGWNNSSYTFTFTNGGLNLGESGSFAIGWQPNCANDVLYNTLDYTPTPEPTTLSLLGLGLLGLFGSRKKRRAA